MSTCAKPGSAPAGAASPAWRDEGLCAQTDPEAFFPERGAAPQLAKRVCQGCPVRPQCLAYALDHNIRFGVWGGLTVKERRRLRRSA
ncbi:WhiB family transcriptional regulator [Nonomuraea rhizosphaerae]|uniref:WhiB family transcriptional regulator n=1 Tax=Nonomuraea rhizosphaerae TaxID=2665663 RepID=UPI001C5F86D0|nr:WhiB family transcriptional regulator [Nonomuraea rhizosphaerae]